MSPHYTTLLNGPVDMHCIIDLCCPLGWRYGWERHYVTIRGQFSSSSHKKKKLYIFFFIPYNEISKMKLYSRVNSSLVDHFWCQKLIMQWLYVLGSFLHKCHFQYQAQVDCVVSNKCQHFTVTSRDTKTVMFVILECKRPWSNTFPIIGNVIFFSAL